MCKFPLKTPTGSSHTHDCPNSVMGCPQVITPCLGGVGISLKADEVAMSGVIPRPVVQLKAQPRKLESWRVCAVSSWVLRTVTVGYTLQLARHSSQIQRGGPVCSFKGAGGNVLLAAKRCIKSRLHGEENAGFNRQYFSKDRTFQPILDLQMKRRF